MKTLFKIIVITSLSTITIAALAEGCKTTGYQKGDRYFGKTDCQQTVLSQLTVNGRVDMNQVLVNSNAVINGTVEGHDLSVKGSLTVNGNTTLNKVSVAGSTIIRGQTTLSDTKLQSITVQGKLNASGSRLANTTVSGSVNLRDVVIKGTLTASTDLAVLNGVDVKNILITKSVPDKSQTVCLEKASVVHGDIKFESEKGAVYTSGASKIMGKVIGGKVIEGACPSEGEVVVQ
ncbi:MAG TPA: hypothetical protein VLJ15_03705 [Gammaproteobacteria bacterium]|nr:hypothetical protein [Gammaproteobacteria bacterium]